MSVRNIVVTVRTVLMGAKAGNSIGLPGKDKIDLVYISSVTGFSVDELLILKNKIADLKIPISAASYRVLQDFFLRIALL